MTLDDQDVEAIVQFIRNTTTPVPQECRAGLLGNAERTFRNAVINETNKPRMASSILRHIHGVTDVNVEELADLRKLHTVIRDLIYASDGSDIAVGDLWKRIGQIIARLECVRKVP